MLELATLINRQARFRGPEPALAFEDRTHSYAQFAERVNRTANALAGIGIRRGDKVASLLGNCRELVDNMADMAHFGPVHYSRVKRFSNIQDGHRYIQVMEGGAEA